MPRDPAVVHPANRLAPSAACATCSMQRLCLPSGMDQQEAAKIDQLISYRHRVPRGDALLKSGAPFRNLYAVRFGHLKTSQINAGGTQQITGFNLAGDLVGMDAIGSGQHAGETVALEDSEVCEVPFSTLQHLMSTNLDFLRHFHRTMSNEITREQSMLLFLGSMKAEQRFGVFLANLSARYQERGYSPCQFELRMSREDIGNYLGVTIESVSRLISRFNKDGVVSIDKREVVIRDQARLQALAAGLQTL